MSIFIRTSDQMGSHNINNSANSVETINGFGSPSQFVRDEWQPSPDFLYSSPGTDEKIPPMSPLNLNDHILDETRTPMNTVPIHSVESPLISHHRSCSMTEPEIEKPEASQNLNIPLLDCQDLIEFQRIMDKLKSRAEMVDRVRYSFARTENSLADVRLPSPFKAEVNKRVMLAALYQGMAKTIRTLGLNEYAIVVPPTVREAARYLNSGFHPVGVNVWQVGKFRYDTSSRVWTPHHPKFSRGH